MSRAERHHLMLLVELARMRAMGEVMEPDDEDRINEQLEAAWFALSAPEQAAVNEQVRHIVAAHLSRYDEYLAMLGLLMADPIESEVTAGRTSKVQLLEESLR